MVKCPDCGAGADLTKDGSYAHCASCNNIFEPGKEGSGYKGSGSGSGDRGEGGSKEGGVGKGEGEGKKEGGKKEGEC